VFINVYQILHKILYEVKTLYFLTLVSYLIISVNNDFVVKIHLYEN